MEVKKQSLTSELKSMLDSTGIKTRFHEILGDNSAAFITSMLQVVNGSKQLQACTPGTIITAAATAASLKLSIVPTLGQAHIVPYKDQAQFQIGWKGLVELCLRTNQYKKIPLFPVYGNQFISWNPAFEQLIGDFSLPPEGKPIGYYAGFELLNGFTKCDYWTLDKVKKHAKSYSKTYLKKNHNGHLFNSAWNKEHEFDSMALKTVIKSVLSKWGVKSIDLIKAIEADQSVQTEEGNFNYPDNEPEAIDISKTEEGKEKARILEHIKNAKTIDELNQVEGFISEHGVQHQFDFQFKKLSSKP